MRVLIKYGVCSGLPIPSEEKEPYTTLRKTFFVLAAAFLAYKMFCAAVAVGSIEDFSTKLYVSSVVVYFFTGFFILLFFYFSHRRFLRLVRRSDELTQSLLDSGFGHESTIFSECRSSATVVSLFVRSMAAVSVICPSFFAMSVPLLDFLAGQYRARTGVPGQCPVEFTVQEYPGVFELIVLQQVIGFFLPSSFRYLSESVMLAFFHLSVTQFRFLSEALEEVGKEKDTASLIKWIKLHQRVITLAYDISSFFSPVILMYYFSTIIAVTGPIIHMLDTKRANILQTTFGGLAMVAALCQLYLQCHAATEITTESENLAIPVYSLPWSTSSDKKYRNLIRLIITACNQPIHMQGYRCPAFRLNRNTYQALFLNAVSTFMAFRKIQEMNEMESEG